MRKRVLLGLFGAIGMLMLILDSKTAGLGAAEGLDLCLRTVIPALFPFFFLSNLLTSALIGQKSRILRPLGRLCRIPEGSECLLLLGFLGGYPTGAQGVAGAYADGQLSRKDAARMLSFCSNVGPSFLFGIGSRCFGLGTLWALWAIHILSALLTGILIPGESGSPAAISGKNLTVPQALDRAVKTMAKVCGWVVLFRILTAFLDRWFLWLLPIPARVGVLGVLELTIGCTSLREITSPELRFVLASVLLALGGLCVLLQTSSVIRDLPLSNYLRGKALQALFSLLLSGLYVQLSRSLGFMAVPVVFLLVFLSVFLLKAKKGVAFSGKKLYNGAKETVPRP